MSVVKKVFSAVIGLAALGLFLAWMGGAFHKKVQPGVVPVSKPLATGRTLVVVEKTLEPETIAAVGSVQPRRKTDVASQLLATIREIKFRPGDRVKTGDPLIILDDRELLAQSREAAASQATAEADLVTRKADYERVKLVLGTGSISIEEGSRIEGAFRVAETQVRRAKESISRIEILISYTKILANADGIVSERNADPGDLASPGKTILSIYDPNDLELHANVPESLTAKMTIGQSLSVVIDANRFSGKALVREVVPQSQQASRSVLVKLALPQVMANPHLPGMFGRAFIPIGQAERIVVPAAAISRQGQLDLVEVVDDQNTLARRFVRLGREFNGQVEVLSGLSAGERVALPREGGKR